MKQEITIRQRETSKSASLTGFTLVEMLVTVAILLILSSLIAVSPNSTTQGRELANTVERIQTELRKTQGFALATQNFNGAPPLGGWGIHFEVGQPCYIIFADTQAPSGNGVYDQAGEVTCDANSNNPGSERFERIFLPASVSMSSVSPSTNGKLDIVYHPPLLATLFNTVLAVSGSPAVLVLQSKNGTTKNIMINSVGNVDVQ